MMTFAQKNNSCVHEIRIFHFLQNSRGCQLSMAAKLKRNEAAGSKFDNSQVTVREKILSQSQKVSVAIVLNLRI